MCGIAGYKSKQKVKTGVLKDMVSLLYHRGPDEDGFYSSCDFHAGMRRLVINDLKTGKQPLFNGSKNVAMLYNGEIYNSPELRRELEVKGRRFRTHSDGEVICHLYDECGEGLFERLDGMFAVALWIEDEEKLILARDIPGEKPLYYSLLPENGIVFASEIKSLKAFPGLDLSLDRQALWDFPTFLWVPEPATIYKSIKALLPGQMLIIDKSGMRFKRIRNLFDKRTGVLSTKEALEGTRSIVEQAVKSRLLSDVPVGSFLSSGLDSSIVATIAAKNLRQLTTFTISFENLSDPYHGYADEAPFAESYAKKIGSRHYTVKVFADTFYELLGDFCKSSDQPFAVSSGLGLLAVARAARERGIKVLLSGDGADECFGGYSWYEYLGENSGVVSGRKKAASSVSFQNFGLDIDERLSFLRSYKAQERAWAWHYYASEREKEGLLDRDYFNGIRSSLRFFKSFNPKTTWSPQDYIRQDRNFYLPNEMLKKVDRMTMAYSVEGRAPFVAPSVLSWAEKLRYGHLVKGHTLKWVLRKAFQDLLPKEVINRPKHGFNVPIDHWLKNEWNFMVKDTFSKNSRISRLGILGKGSAARAQGLLFDKGRLNGHTIFTFIMLNQWLERCN